MKVYEALEKAGRLDLIGFDKKCLVKPKRGQGTAFVNKDNKFNQKDSKSKKKKAIRNVHKKKIK